MTVLELFKTKTIDEIVDAFCKEYEEYGYTVPRCAEWRLPILYSNVFHDWEECKDNFGCEYLECGDYGDFTCDRKYLNASNASCPYGINKKDVFKKQIKDWLNMDISE